MHLLDVLGLCFKFPRVEQVPYFPVDGVLGQSPHEVLGYPHLVLVPSPPAQIAVEDAFPLLLESLYHGLDFVRNVVFLVDDVVVVVVFYPREELLIDLAYHEGTVLVYEQPLNRAPLHLH